MAVTWGSSPLGDIVALEHERRALWDAAAGRLLYAGEIERLQEICRLLDRRWEQRRQETAGAKAGYLIEVVVGEDAWPLLDQARGRALQVANM